MLIHQKMPTSSNSVVGAGSLEKGPSQMGAMGAADPPSSSVIKILEKSKHTMQKEIEIIHLALVFWFWNNLLNLECDLYMHTSKVNEI